MNQVSTAEPGLAPSSKSRRAPGRGTILRYTADRRSIAFVATFFALVVYQWFAAPRSPWLAAPLLVATCVLSWITAVITHNSIHSPVFRRRWLNNVWQVALTLAYGFPVSEYHPGHNLSHHRYTQKRKDVMRTSKVRFRWNLLNLLWFFGSVGAGVTAGNMRYIKLKRTERPRWYRQYLLETILSWSIRLALIAIDWRKGLLYFALPHFFAVWGITTVNYLQHDGCDADSPYNHSRNFVGRIFNWFTFNNGYHTIHHDEAGLHWSLLAEAHRTRVHPHIHPALEQQSLLVYCVKAFVWPGRRVRYDGKPVVLPDEGPDEDWMLAPGEEPESVAAA